MSGATNPKDKAPAAPKLVTAVVAHGRILQAEDGKSLVAGDELELSLIHI